jgi:hypothetical protein
MSLVALTSEHGPLPATINIATGGGGRHFYFDPRGKRFSSSAGTLARGVDVKAVGGYVVGPVSLHESGRRYELNPDGAPLAPLPGWLVERLRQSTGNGAAKSAAEWSRIAREGLIDGSRNVTIASVAGHLFRRNVAVDIAVPMLLAWNREYGMPPLDEDEALKTIDSIASREAWRKGRGHARR